MSTFPAAAEVSPLRGARAAGLNVPRSAALAVALAVLGLSTIWSSMHSLWAMWTSDALKSIGMFVPLVSLVLILRVWRSLGWEMDGSWWGLGILVATAIVVQMRDRSILILVLSPQWQISLPPPPLVVFAYGAGVVLLFGGTRLFRAALFPLVLLFFVNPVPHIFNTLIDLPLQRASAHVARSFAIALGQPLSPDQLRLMFTPDFGMFIAPGCNGIRGAITMGFIALVAGHIYRFRWYAHAAVVAGAVLLGYVFNFARLCILVLYYIVALRITWLQNRAEMGDYIIGACLFLVGTFLLFYVVRRLSESRGQIKPPAMTFAGTLAPASVPSFYPRFASLLLLVLFSSYGVARSYAYAHSGPFAAQMKAEQDAPGQFPARIGRYALSRTWNENFFTGPLIYHWAQYVEEGGTSSVSIGISPVLGSHDTLICHTARGEDPLWRDQLTLATASNVLVDFSGSFFNDGATQYLEATTVCSGGFCGEHSSDGKHIGFLYSKPDTHSLFTQEPQRPIPILLRAETIDTTLPAELARQQLMTTMRTFLSSVDLDGLTQPYRHQ
ncbi:MAG TPA: exosortase J [Edaphobacter sp.]|jgi:exosortase J|nr:exosortase J [Edaphobacter sp.]